MQLSINNSDIGYPRFALDLERLTRSILVFIRDYLAFILIIPVLAILLIPTAILLVIFTATIGRFYIHVATKKIDKKIESLSKLKDLDEISERRLMEEEALIRELLTTLEIILSNSKKKKTSNVYYKIVMGGSFDRFLTSFSRLREVMVQKVYPKRDLPFSDEQINELLSAYEGIEPLS